MCGKFTQLASWNEVVAFSQPLTIPVPSDITIATPMRFAHIMRLNEQGKRVMVSTRWGFAGKNDPSPSRPKHMHARCETIDTRTTFAHAFAHGRGICFVRTFNEGEDVAGKTKQWVITPHDNKPIAIAVICEEWRSGADTLPTFIMVTTPANQLIGRITDRMPAILHEEDWPIWLGETDAPPSDVKAVLRTFEDNGSWTMAPQEPTRRPKRAPDPPRSLL